VQLHKHQDDLFILNSKLQGALKLIERYIISVSPDDANSLLTISKALYEKINWASLETYLYTVKTEDIYISDSEKYYAWVLVIQEEQPALENFFKDVPALIQLREEVGNKSKETPKSLITVDFTVPQLASLVKFLQDSKVIDKIGAAALTNLIIENFTTKAKQGKPITKDSFKTEKSNADAQEFWRGKIISLLDYLK
jgi:hypothetical protein